MTWHLFLPSAFCLFQCVQKTQFWKGIIIRAWQKNLNPTLPFGQTSLKCCLPWVSHSFLFPYLVGRWLALTLCPLRMREWKVTCPTGKFICTYWTNGWYLFWNLIMPKRKLTYSQGYKKSYDLLLDKSRNNPFSKLYHKITFNWEAYKRIQLKYNHWRAS